MENFGYEKLDVYQCSIEFLGLAGRIIHRLPSGYSTLIDQFHRASLSIPLNIAEACGKPSPKDRANRYAIARGSTLECGAIIDALKTLSLIPDENYSRAKDLLVRSASMLSKLIRPNSRGIRDNI
jgi:four helix bundle protein